MSMFHRPLPRTLPAALRDIEDKKVAVRRSAVQDLARHAGTPSAEVVAALTKALRDTDPAVRTQAAYSLGDANASDALPALMVAMDDAETSVRQAAIDALGQIGDRRATARLLRATEDDRPDVRFQALISLARVSPDDGAEAALRGARDDDTHVRYISVRMIEEVFASEESGKGPEVNLDDRFHRAACTWLSDTEPAVRVAAAILLARAGFDDGASMLLEVLEGRVKVDAEDESTMVMLVGSLRMKEAVPALERRAFGLRKLVRESFSWNALVSLAQLDHPRARETIIRDLSAWSRDRRTTAVVAAGRGGVIEARPIIESMKGDDTKADGGAVQEALDLLGAAQGS